MPAAAIATYGGRQRRLRSMPGQRLPRLPTWPGIRFRMSRHPSSVDHSENLVAQMAFRTVSLRQRVDGAEYSGPLVPSESRTVQARWRAPDEDPPERMAERSVPDARSLPDRVPVPRLIRVVHDGPPPLPGPRRSIPRVASPPAADRRIAVAPRAPPSSARRRGCVVLAEVTSCPTLLFQCPRSPMVGHAYGPLILGTTLANASS